MEVLSNNQKSIRKILFGVTVIKDRKLWSSKKNVGYENI